MIEISRESIIKASEGDIDSFEEIYRSNSGFVYNIAFRVAGNAKDAEEITQDVFIKVYKISSVSRSVRLLRPGFTG
jgi:DNA-directed RNA polymerase specialized sigma24 family protein